MTCPRCLDILVSEESLLNHSRWCNAGSGGAVGSAGTEPFKRVRRVGVFNRIETGVEPQFGGRGPRKKDACVMIPATDGDDAMDLAPLTEPLSTERAPAEIPSVVADEVEDTTSEIDVWTSAASTEEVVEAMRRQLLNFGVKAGAKAYDLFIKLQHHPSYWHDAYKRAITSHRDLVQDANSPLEATLLSLRFKREAVTDDQNEVEASMWLRKSMDVVMRQIRQLTFDVEEENSLRLWALQQVAQWRACIFPSFVSTTCCARSRASASRSYERIQGRCEGGSWMVRQLRLCASPPTLLGQILATLKTNSHTHFPLHVAVMNTSIKKKEEMILNGDTVVGYLPTSMEWTREDQEKWETEREDAVGGRGSRGSKLQVLHNVVEKCLRPLLDKTLSGFEVRDSQGRPRKCHPVLWSYVTDLPEGWDMSSGVHGRCSRCMVEKADLCSTVPSTMKTARTISLHYDALDRAIGKGKAALRGLMWKSSLSPWRPYLLSLGENYGVDLFRS